MVTPPHSGGGGVATPSSVGSEPAPPDEAAAVLAAIAAASLHTLEPACLWTAPCAYIRVHVHACYSVYMRTQSSLTHVHPTGEPADARAAGRAAGTARRARQAGGTYTHILADACTLSLRARQAGGTLIVTGNYLYTGNHMICLRGYMIYLRMLMYTGGRAVRRGEALQRGGRLLVRLLT